VKYTGNNKEPQRFSFSTVTVPSKTLTFLPDGSCESLEVKGLQVECEEEQ